MASSSKRHSFDSEPPSSVRIPPLSETRSNSMPIPGSKKLMDTTKTSLPPPRSGRSSVSNENNVLLDPEVLTDYPTQTLVLTVLVCLVLFVCLFYIS